MITAATNIWVSGAIDCPPAGQALGDALTKPFTAVTAAASEANQGKEPAADGMLAGAGLVPLCIGLGVGNRGSAAFTRWGAAALRAAATTGRVVVGVCVVPILGFAAAIAVLATLPAHAPAL